MAQSLVRDPHRSEDVAQESALIALERAHPPKDSRGWLRGVVHHRARRAHCEAARARRDASLAEDPAWSHPPTDEVVANAEIKRAIAESLLDLPDDQRVALHLVYFADLSFGAAGERIGVAKSTVSERVRKGLEALRRKLDSKHGGNRSAWAGPIAGFALRAPVRATVQGTTVRNVVALLAVLVAGVAVVTMIALRGRGTESPFGATEEPLSATRIADPAGADVSGRADPERYSAGSSRRVSLGGGSRQGDGSLPRFERSRRGGARSGC